MKTIALKGRKYLRGNEVDALLKFARSRMEGMGEGTYGRRAAWRDLLIVRTLLATGLRNTELRGLKRSQINFDTDEVELVGKGGKAATIDVIDSGLCRVLEGYLGEREGYLFLNMHGAPLSKSGLWRIVRALGKGAGIENLRPHHLRHTHAVHFLNGDLNVKELQEQLRHSSLAITEQYLTMEREARRERIRSRRDAVMASMTGNGSGTFDNRSIVGFPPG